MENDQVVEKSKSDWIRCYSLLEKMSAVVWKDRWNAEMKRQGISCRGDGPSRSLETKTLRVTILKSK